jgi:hypothetical protein
MKVVPLRIGAKGDRAAVKVNTRIAENFDELTELAHNDPSVVVRWANRGKRIEDQERSGARDAFKEGKSAEEIQELVNSYDPTVVKPRGSGTRGPRTKKVKLEAAQVANIPDSLRELLAAQGVVIEEAPVAAS